MTENKKKSGHRRDPAHPRRWVPAFGVTAILGILMLFYYYSFPHADIGPEQPVPFSHRVHAGTKRIDCRFCHPFPDHGPRATLPPMSKCLFCHDYVIPRHPEILKDKNTLVTGQPILWKRVFYVPDYVQFNHEPHIRWAGFDCNTCHGPVETYDRLIVRRFEMGFCVTCHRDNGAQIDCWLACHH